MAYTLLGCVLMFASAILGGLIAYLAGGSFRIVIMAGYGIGIFMIFGADWLLQRTAWGRSQSTESVPPTLDDLEPIA